MADPAVARITPEPSKRHAIQERPSSGQSILAVLKKKVKLTSKEIVQNTQLSSGPHSAALQRLREGELVPKTRLTTLRACDRLRSIDQCVKKTFRIPK